MWLCLVFRKFALCIKGSKWHLLKNKAAFSTKCVILPCELEVCLRLCTTDFIQGQPQPGSDFNLLLCNLFTFTPWERNNIREIFIANVVYSRYSYYLSLLLFSIWSGWKLNRMRSKLLPIDQDAGVLAALLPH
jgi:hypothetical protein